jgi:hypothetical protein
MAQTRKMAGAGALAKTRVVKASGLALALVLCVYLAPHDASMRAAAQLEEFGAVALPTLGEWGMLLATLSLLAAGTSVILRRRRR